MDIAVIVPSLKQAGPVNVAYDLTRLYITHGHRVEVFYFDKLKEFLHEFPCKCTCLSHAEVDFDRFDIVHSHGQRPAAYVYKNRKKNMRTRFVSTAHNYVFQDYIYKYGRLKGLAGGVLYLRYLMAHDSVVTLSRDAMEYYAKWIPRNKLTYIYNSRITIDSSIPNNALLKSIRSFKGDGILIGTNASLIKRKGLDVLIKAIAKLPVNFKVAIAGDGSERDSLEMLSHELGVTDRVKLLGFVNNAHSLIGEYDIFCLPSRSEGFPLGLLEAAAIGKTSVASDLPVLTEAFDGDELLTFKNGDSNDLAKKIEEASQTPQLGSNLKAAYYRAFSPEIFYDNYIRLYNSLITD